MNSKIIKISYDQNEITHESGVVTVAKECDGSCIGCYYFDMDLSFDCSGNKMPCMSDKRFDNKTVIFILKQPTT